MTWEQNWCPRCRKALPSSRGGRNYHFTGQCKDLGVSDMTTDPNGNVAAVETCSPEPIGAVPTPRQTPRDHTASYGVLDDSCGNINSSVNPRIGTVAYYKNKMDNPVYQGSKSNVKEYLLDVFETFVKSGMSIETFEKNILERDRKFVESLEPIIPKSLYLVRESLDVPSIDQVEYHICPCQQHIYKHVAKEEWILHRDEKCPKCEKSRFRVVTKPDGSLMVSPRKVFYAFKLESQIKRLFRIPEFARKRGTQRDSADTNSFFKSRHWKWIKQVTNGEAAEHSNSVYSIGFDWCQAAKSKDHSMGVVSLRCEDLPPDLAHKDIMTLPLLYLPGPKEPKCLNIFFNVIADEFIEAAEKGISVSYTNSSGQLVQMQHKPFWAFIHCDSPARSKLGCFNGANALFCCPFCRHPSSQAPGQTTYKPLGYCKEVQYTHIIPLTKREKKYKTLSYQMGVPGKRQRLNQSLMAGREKKFEGLLAEAECEHAMIRKEMGINGTCDLFGRVKTLHRVHAFVLPFYHLIFLGVIKTFFTAIVKEDPKRKKKKKKRKKSDEEQDKGGQNEPSTEEIAIKQLSKLSDLNKCIISTSDLGRKPRCLTNIRAFIIEEVKNLWEFQGTLLLHPRVAEKLLGGKSGTLPPLAKKAWGHLRRGIDFFMDPTTVAVSENGHTSTDAREAADNLLEFAKVCEEHFPSVCTQNLHILICRLLDQEKETGKAKFMNELHIERSLQFFKQYAKGKDNPEKTAVRKLLDIYYLEENGRRAHIADCNRGQDSGTQDIGAEPSRDTDVLKGKQSKPTAEQLQYIKAFLDQNETRFDQRNCLVYRVANLQRNGKKEKVTSSIYRKERTKQSNTVFVNVSPSRDSFGVGVVQYFFTVEEDSRMIAAAAIMMYPDDHLIFHPDEDCGTIIEVKMDKKARKKGNIQCFPLDKILTKAIRLNCSYLDHKGRVTESKNKNYTDFLSPKSQTLFKH